MKMMMDYHFVNTASDIISQFIFINVILKLCMKENFKSSVKFVVLSYKIREI